MVLNATFKTISMISWRSENLRSTCTTLCERQLSDDRFNNKLDKDPTKQFSDEITNELNNVHDNGDIDDKTLEYLISDRPIPGRLYLLPKIHKANNPGRPIVSAKGHPAEKISGFVDFHLYHPTLL